MMQKIRCFFCSIRISHRFCHHVNPCEASPILRLRVVVFLVWHFSHTPIGNTNYYYYCYIRSITATSLLTDFASCGLRWRRWFVGALNKRSVIRTNIIWISVAEQGENAVHHCHCSSFVSCKHYTAETSTAVWAVYYVTIGKQDRGEERTQGRERKREKRKKGIYIYIILLYLLLYYCVMKNGVRSTDTTRSVPPLREKRTDVRTGARFF